MKHFLSEIQTSAYLKLKWVPEAYLEPSQIFLFQFFSFLSQFFKYQIHNQFNCNNHDFVFTLKCFVLVIEIFINTRGSRETVYY